MAIKASVKFTGVKKDIDDTVKLGLLSPRLKKSVALKIGRNPVIRSGTVIYAGTRIGNNLQTGHNAVIREQNEIADNFCLWNNSVVDYGCKIGKNVKIHSNCYIAQYTSIEDDVFIAPGVTMANDIHPRCGFSKVCMRGPTIKKGAKIGVNVTILPYVTVGAGSLVGSGSVVTKDIPPYSVVWGNPARVRKKVWELACHTGRTKRPYKKKS
jgi:acetyltransferase-like isoleucine patch superfamily enzyme